MNRCVLKARALPPLLALAATLVACDPANDDDSAAPEGSFAAVVLQGPFSGDATLLGMDPDGAALDVDPVGLAGTDWALGGGSEDFWLIGRLGSDVVRRYEWPTTSAPALEFAAGTPTNPQVALECGGRIFVTRYGLGVQGGGGDVAVFDLDGGAQGRVDLSAFHEGDDGTPEPSSMVERDGVLYVGLQRLDRNAGWVADPVGKVVAIDCETEAITGSWDAPSNLEVFVADEEIYALGGGVLTRFDGSAFVASSILDALPSSPIALAAAADGWVVVTETEQGANTVWCVDPAGQVTELESPDTRAWTAAVDPAGRAWVGFRDHWITGDVEPGGIGIYDPVTCVREQWIATESDPIDIAFTGIR